MFPPLEKLETEKRHSQSGQNENKGIICNPATVASTPVHFVATSRTHLKNFIDCKTRVHFVTTASVQTLEPTPFKSPPVQARFLVCRDISDRQSITPWHRHQFAAVKTDLYIHLLQKQ